MSNTIIIMQEIVQTNIINSILIILKRFPIIGLAKGYRLRFRIPLFPCILVVIEFIMDRDKSDSANMSINTPKNSITVPNNAKTFTELPSLVLALFIALPNSSIDIDTIRPEMLSLNVFTIDLYTSES